MNDLFVIFTAQNPAAVSSPSDGLDSLNFLGGIVGQTPSHLLAFFITDNHQVPGSKSSSPWQDPDCKKAFSRIHQWSWLTVDDDLSRWADGKRQALCFLLLSCSSGKNSSPSSPAAAAWITPAAARGK